MSGMRRHLFVVALIGLVAVAVVQTASATQGQLVRKTQTSSWSTPSTDPTGLTYDPKLKKLLISDSEVDETGFWKKRNLFVASKKGALRGTRRLTKATFEPEGISWYPHGKSLFVVDDDKDAIFRFGRGHDRKIGTKDDKVRQVVNTLRYGSRDAEGVTWHTRRGKLDMLIWTDATTTKVYELKRGHDHRFGTSDDVEKREFAASNFSFKGRNMMDPNGVFFDRKTGDLFIVDTHKHFVVESTLAGALVQTIDMPFCRADSTTAPGCHGFSDVVFAPGPSGARRLYLTDRGVDNEVNPNENDGRLYQVKLVP
jgi:sugar lactone lactonase YvrE